MAKDTFNAAMLLDSLGGNYAFKSFKKETEETVPVVKTEPDAKKQNEKPTEKPDGSAVMTKNQAPVRKPVSASAAVKVSRHVKQAEPEVEGEEYKHVTKRTYYLDDVVLEALRYRVFKEPGTSASFHVEMALRTYLGLD